jgi:hypothetical protein
VSQITDELSSVRTRLIVAASRVMDLPLVVILAIGGRHKPFLRV